MPQVSEESCFLGPYFSYFKVSEHLGGKFTARQFNWSYVFFLSPFPSVWTTIFIKLKLISCWLCLIPPKFISCFFLCFEGQTWTFPSIYWTNIGQYEPSSLKEEPFSVPKLILLFVSLLFSFPLSLLVILSFVFLLAL